MSMWGVFHDQNWEIHVIPCSPDGRVLEPHERGMDCFCKPQLDHEAPLWVHRDRERGTRSPSA